MATFVIVHGAWGGGWEWAAVARALRERGHDVFTPTLTGMGDRAHLAGPHVGLDTHVDDVVSVLEFEDLRDVVLCGHSSGGMAVSGAADRVADRVRLVVYIDALVPEDGQSALELLPAQTPDGAEWLREPLEGWRIPVPEALLPSETAASAVERARYIARLRDSPLAMFTEPVHLTGALDQIAHAFIRCTGADFGERDPIAQFAARAHSEGWLYRELETSHDPQLTDPTGTAALLDELAATVPPESSSR
ncbi:MAG: alpha/beta hydrolase [Acidimicrobiales bacterium]